LPLDLPATRLKNKQNSKNINKNKKNINLKNKRKNQANSCKPSKHDVISKTREILNLSSIKKVKSQQI